MIIYLPFPGCMREIMSRQHDYSPRVSANEENFISHSEGPTEQFGMDLKGARSAG